MSVTVDANVLVYASNDADSTHGAARALIERLATGPDLVHLFWPTIMGYLRIVTHSGILPRPLAFAEATANIASLLERPHARAGGEASGFWRLFAATAGHHARGNQVPDAHLVALMRQQGVATVYTRDRELRRYEGIEVRDPFV